MREFSSRSHVVFSEGDDPGVDVVAHARTMRASRQIRASARLRILGWILALTTLAVVGALLLARRLLLEQLDSEVNDPLEQEIEEMPSWRRATTRQTGNRSATTSRPSSTRSCAGTCPTRARRTSRSSTGASTSGRRRRWRWTRMPEAGGRWAGLDGARTRASSSTDAGPVRCMAVPLQDATGETLGVFVVANFVRGERAGDRRRDQHLGWRWPGPCWWWRPLVAWVAAGRILRPVREADRDGPGDQRDRPVRPHPGGGRRRDRRAGPHVQRHARPAGGGVRHPAGVHRRRRPRAAHPDHDRARPPRAAGRRPRRAAARRSRWSPTSSTA